MTVTGDISLFTNVTIDQIASTFASAASVPKHDVDIRLQSASVLISVAIVVPTARATSVTTTLDTALSTPASATAFLSTVDTMNLNVEQINYAPAIVVDGNTYEDETGVSSLSLLDSAFASLEVDNPSGGEGGSAAVPVVVTVSVITALLLAGVGFYFYRKRKRNKQRGGGFGNSSGGGFGGGMSTMGFGAGTNSPLSSTGPLSAQRCTVNPVSCSTTMNSHDEFGANGPLTPTGVAPRGNAALERARAANQGSGRFQPAPFDTKPVSPDTKDGGKDGWAPAPGGAPGKMQYEEPDDAFSLHTRI